MLRSAPPPPPLTISWIRAWFISFSFIHLMNLFIGTMIFNIIITQTRTFNESFMLLECTTNSYQDANKLEPNKINQQDTTLS